MRSPLFEKGIKLTNDTFLTYHRLYDAIYQFNIAVIEYITDTAVWT